VTHRRSAAPSRFQRRREEARLRRERWAAKLEHLRRRPAKPVESHHEESRQLVREAQRVNPAVRTVRGAKKLDRRLTHQAAQVRRLATIAAAVESAAREASGATQ